MKSSRFGNKTAFSLFELLATVTIISLLMAVLFPMAIRYRDKARETKCAANLRAISGAVALWSSENDGKLPNSMDKSVEGWKKRIAPYLGVVIQPGDGEPGSPEAPVTVFTCPSVKDDKTVDKRSYAFNPNLNDGIGITDDPIAGLARKSGTIMVAEQLGGSWLQSIDAIAFRHMKRANALFCDGHVEGLTSADVTRLGKSKLIEGKY